MIFSQKRRFREFLFIALISAVIFSGSALAELASPDEARRVCDNWLNLTVYQKGIWAGSAAPYVGDAREITDGGILLAYYFEIEPAGYVIVPALKEMAPVKVFSTENWLDFSEPDGFTHMIRELLSSRYESYINLYGSLEASQPADGEVMFGREQRQDWDRFTQDEATFKAGLTAPDKNADEVGPLLTSYWHQSAPYNNLCPWGDGGRTVVGCVATAAAQILAYHQWPPQGTGTHTYYWSGDNSCGGNTSGAMLSADYSDTYDWENIPDNCSNCSPEEQAALAELNSEVGIAFDMDYGRCGSGAYTADAMNVFPNYFRFKDSIQKHNRPDYGQLLWSDMIKAEMENGRPCQYRIHSHSIVCDGWRMSGIYHQVHMNYGWGGSNNYWYTIDNLYCPWDGCTPNVEFILTHIIPDKGVHFVADTTWGRIPLEVQFEGLSELPVDSWSWTFGDGTSDTGQTPKHTFNAPGRFDVSVEIDAGGDIRSYAAADFITILADSVIGLDANGEPGTEIEVTVYAANTLPLRKIKLPVSYAGPLNLTLTSFSTAGCRTDNFDQKKKVSTDPTNKRAAFSFYNTSTTSPDMEPGTGPILILYFSIPAGASPSQTADLEFLDYSSHLLKFTSPFLEYVPEFVSSDITLTYICGDADYNQEVNILDITYLIAYVYLYGPPPLPLISGNVDGSGEINILDITYLINYLYNGGPAPDCR